MCKISIIMPVYNKEKYVRHAIDSVIAQTFIDWELVIIDDGSTDSSFEICRQYKDARIHLIRVENGGVSRARNLGLEKAQGEYVTFIDSDDWIAEDYLESLYKPRYDMIVSGLTKVDKTGMVIATVCPSLTGEQTIQEVGKGFYQEQIETGIYGFVAGKLIKRSIIQENQICFDEKIKLAEDYDFYLNVYLEINQIYFLEYAGYYYLQETENSAIAMRDEEIDFFVQTEIQKKTKRFLTKIQCFSRKDEEIYLKRMAGYVYTILLLNKRLSYQAFLKLYDRLKKEIPEVSENISGMGKWCIRQYKKNRKRMIYLFLKLKSILG